MTDRCIDGTLAHRWNIEAPNGTPHLHGVCRRCEATKVFLASVEFWDTDRPVGRAGEGFGWLNQVQANRNRAELRVKQNA